MGKPTGFMNRGSAMASAFQNARSGLRIGIAAHNASSRPIAMK